MLSPRPVLCLAAALAATAMAFTACEQSKGSATCGIAALTGPLAIKESFAQGRVLSALPEAAPTALSVRLVAGPLFRATVAAAGKTWALTVHDAVSPDAHPGYGVLVVDGNADALGVVVFDGPPVLGAPRLGTIALRDTTVPLLGVRLERDQIQTPACPIFPDSQP